MGWETKSVLIDQMGKPVPQYLNPITGSPEPLYGRNGANRVELYGPDGNPISTTGGVLNVTLSGSLVSPNNTLKVRDSYLAKESHRVLLTPGSESAQTFVAAFEALQVLNYGPGDVYLDIDSAAAIGGADDVLIQEGTSISIPVVGTTVHLIGSSASVVQLVGYRTPAV